MKKLLVGLCVLAILVVPAGAWAGGYKHHHHRHHHNNHAAEYVALGILGGVLGGIVLGHALADHDHYAPPPPRAAYAPEPAYCAPVHRYGTAYAPRRPCY